MIQILKIITNNNKLNHKLIMFPWLKIYSYSNLIKMIYKFNDKKYKKYKNNNYIILIIKILSIIISFMK